MGPSHTSKRYKLYRDDTHHSWHWPPVRFIFSRFMRPQILYSSFFLAMSRIMFVSKEPSVLPSVIQDLSSPSRTVSLPSRLRAARAKVSRRLRRTIGHWMWLALRLLGSPCPRVDLVLWNVRLWGTSNGIECTNVAWTSWRCLMKTSKINKAVAQLCVEISRLVSLGEGPDRNGDNVLSHAFTVAVRFRNSNYT